MTFEQWLYETLTAPSAATQAVVAGRVHPVIAPKNSPTPYIVYEVTTTEDDLTFCGPSGLQAIGVEISARATDFDTVAALARSVVADLRAAAGAQLVEQDSVSDAMDPEPGLYDRSINLTVWFNQE